MADDDLSHDERAYEAFLRLAQDGGFESVDRFLADWPASSPLLRASIAKLARALPAERGLPDLGPYEALERLGAGGMGEVWRARDAHGNHGNRIVAVKRLSAAFSASPAHVERFRREARLLAKLKHEGIATILAMRNANDGARLLVMECVEGEDLAACLLFGALERSRACAIALGIAEALEAAHLAGVVHRDLKPSNVMLRPDERVKLLDFGLGKHIDGGTVGLTGAGEQLGTPGYMSPEQALGLSIDERTDVFAFGCVFFELLSGARAFGPGQPESFDPARLPDGLASELVALIAGCLALDAAARPANMGHVRAALQAALSDESD